jgi:uncharacterized protein YbjT (DUF2867 family)
LRWRRNDILVPVKLAVFGATGRTGRHLVQQALAAGHEIVALVRTPGKLGELAAKLDVIQGDATAIADVEKAVAGADAVLSVLGPTAGAKVMTSAGRNIIAAMRGQGVSRLITLTGAGVRAPLDTPGFIDQLFGVLLRLFARSALEDAVGHVDAIRSSGLRWTVVRVPMLRDGPGGAPIVTGYAGQGPGTKIDRADAARFILAQLDDETWVGKAPMISN